MEIDCTHSTCLVSLENFDSLSVIVAQELTLCAQGDRMVGSKAVEK
jgi:hypothetical protein